MVTLWDECSPAPNCQPTRARASLSDRFDSKVMPEPNSGCWLWAGSCLKNGYGSINSGGGNGRSLYAHRVAWTLYRGPIPDGLFVLHKCDVRSCVNPDHLFLGTHLDNIKDMRTKGRHAHGTTNGHAKINEEQVRAIRSSNLSFSAMSRKFGLCVATIHEIRSGKIWRHVV